MARRKNNEDQEDLTKKDVEAMLRAGLSVVLHNALKQGKTEKEIKANMAKVKDDLVHSSELRAAYEEANVFGRERETMVTKIVKDMVKTAFAG